MSKMVTRTINSQLLLSPPVEVSPEEYETEYTKRLSIQAESVRRQGRQLNPYEKNSIKEGVRNG